MSRKIRVLVVDDSRTMQILIGSILEESADIEVVGYAPNPNVARDMIKELRPDVLTLDIEMPGMSGLEFLEKLMRLNPMPVVMCSTLTQKGAEASIEALRLGAVGCFAKPTSGRGDAFETGRHEFLSLIRRAATANVRALAQSRAQIAPPTNFESNGKIVAVGASTGGVEALFTLLKEFPKNCPPTLIVQHMPPAFTSNFAKRLNTVTEATVKEAENGEKVEAGCVYIAPGGDCHMTLDVGQGGSIRLARGLPVNGHCPSVDKLFHSVAKVARGNAVGAILTGMGEDGASGLLEMRVAGAHTIAQNKATCVVWGMPQAAVALGAATAEMPLDRIAAAILRESRRMAAAA